jgi:hypothetical protein
MQHAWLERFFSYTGFVLHAVNYNADWRKIIADARFSCPMVVCPGRDDTLFEPFKPEWRK